jgi:hypothetical protein
MAHMGLLTLMELDEGLLQSLYVTPIDWSKGACEMFGRRHLLPVVRWHEIQGRLYKALRDTTTKSLGLQGFRHLS